MKHLVMSLLSILVAQSVLSAKAEEPKEVEITISADRETISPCEPLGVVTTLHNKGDKSVQRIESRWTSIRIRKKGDADWETYMPCGPHAGLLPPDKLELLPGEKRQFAKLIHVKAGNEAVFREPGVYYIQAGTPFGESEPISVKVADPVPAMAALDAVHSRKLYMLFDEYTARVFLEAGGSAETLAKDLNDFRRAPASTNYMAWVTFADFILKKALISRQAKSEQSTSLEKLVAEYRKLTSVLPSPQKESLMIAMAAAEMEQSKKDGAIDLLQQVITAHADGYFRVYAQYLRSLYDGR